MLIPLSYSSVSQSDELITHQNQNKIKSKLKHKTQFQSHKKNVNNKTVKKYKEREYFGKPEQLPLPKNPRHKIKTELDEVYNQEDDMKNKSDDLTSSEITNMVDSMTDENYNDDYNDNNSDSDNDIDNDDNPRKYKQRQRPTNKNTNTNKREPEAMQSMNFYNQSQPRNFKDQDNILYQSKELKSNLSKYPVSGSNDLVTKLNQLIMLLEEQQEEKTGNIMEELILYSFLGIFMIYLVDSFVKVGKYTR